MRPNPIPSRALAALAAVLMTAALLTACSNDGDDECDAISTTDTTGAAGTSIAAMQVGGRGGSSGGRSNSRSSSGSKHGTAHKPKPSKQKPAKPSKPHKTKHHDSDDCDDD